jgi:acylphosphatase
MLKIIKARFLILIMKLHKNFQVIGKVQGVGFRFSCMEAAYKHNIKGFVTNRRDGSVYVEAEGEEDNLDKFILWLKKGPVWAKVNQVLEETGSLKDYPSFEIVR